MARSVRNLCARHQSELAVPLGRWCNDNGNGSREGETEDEGAAMANAQLWVNDQLADVRDFSFLQQLFFCFLFFILAPLWLVSDDERRFPRSFPLSYQGMYIRRWIE